VNIKLENLQNLKRRKRIWQKPVHQHGRLIVLLSVIIPALLWTDLRMVYLADSVFTITLVPLDFLDDYLKVVRKKPKDS